MNAQEGTILHHKNPVIQNHKNPVIQNHKNPVIQSTEKDGKTISRM